MASTPTRSASMRPPASGSTCKSPRPVTAWMRFNSRWMSFLMVIVPSLCCQRGRLWLPVKRLLALLLRWSPGLRVLFAVEGKDDLGLFQGGLDMDRTLPELVQVRERVLGV